MTIEGDQVHLSQMSYDQNERCRGSPTSRQRYRLFYLLDVLLIVRSEETDLTALLVHSPDNSKPLFGKLCWLLFIYIILEHPCVQIFNHLESTCEIQETALRSSMTEYINCDCSRNHGQFSLEYSTLLESCHSPPFRNGA